MALDYQDTLMRTTMGLQQVLAPRRSVIVDMIMVQFISVILTCLGVLVFAGESMASNDVAIYLVAIMVSLVFITSLYSKITR